MSTVKALKPIKEIYSLSDSASSDLAFALEWVERKMAQALSDLPDVIVETRKAIQFYLDSDSELLGCGGTRICFADRDNRVIKIPFTLEGYFSSANEVVTYEKFQKNPDAGLIPTAECFLSKVEGINITLLSMERLLEFPEFGELLPKWVDSVDAGQVGYNSKGELVAYDL